MERATYLLHQTPEELCKELIPYVPLEPNDTVIEPFKGEGNFYRNFPATVSKEWAELEEGKDYTSITTPYDWVITNPPYRLDAGEKRVNSFWFLLDYYSQRSQKGIAFLANDRCFSTLTPRRLGILKDRGWSIYKIVVCSVKKWRGRYFFVILTKKPTDFFVSLPTNF